VPKLCHIFTVIGFYRATLRIPHRLLTQNIYACTSLGPSVRPSVTLRRYCVQTARRIGEILSPPGSYIVLVQSRFAETPTLNPNP